MKSRNLFLRQHSSNPFISLVERIDDSSSKTVFGADHNKIRQIAPLQQMRIDPLWLQVIHADNVMNAVPKYSWQIPMKRLPLHFDVDYYIHDESIFTVWIGNIKRLGNRFIARLRRMLLASFN